MSTKSEFYSLIILITFLCLFIYFIDDSNMGVDNRSNIITSKKVMNLSVLSFNVWGLKYVSKNREDRIRAIAEHLALGKYDLVSLQEVWSQDDFELIKEKCLGVLPYSHYFYSGVVGSGVCFLSRYPIEEVFFHQWSLNGYIHKIQHGDWFGGKGVGLCHLNVNNIKVNAYIVHLHAEYDRGNDEYLVHRVLQAYNTAQFIKQTSAYADLVILAGDLNTEPTDLAYRIFTSVAGLTDSYYKCQVPESMFATNLALQNTYTPQSRVKDKTPGIRIDYIMYHSSKTHDVVVKKYELPLSKPVENEHFSYSDHEAVHVDFGITKKNPESMEEPVKEDSVNHQEILMESHTLCKDHMKHLHKHKIFYFTIAFIVFIILVLCNIAFVPYGYHVLYAILKIILVVVILYCFLMGSIWNRMEKNAIKESVHSMELLLKKYQKVNKQL
ncbi:unnamed protein product [Brassicogethes aeneus]|uniref:sphingomyelin phosphodiesterase n=1 Tax=Brassicogethes aeneus TaxID=1431903 RepID=A0A9P0BD11_BRAAE|nr:unnamed protein product [Brassicogethes aeneus]